MRHALAFTFLFPILLCGLARAGDPVVPRKQFRESSAYPFVFKPESYLAGRGPLPMRFASAGPSCEARRPPAPPAIAKSEAAAEPTAAKPATEPAPALAAQVETTPKREPPDFSKVPDEVLDFFKNTEGRPVRRAYLFDPIFQPVTPDDLPKSKATSQQK